MIGISANLSRPMASKKYLPPVLHTALNLDGSPGSIKKFYAEWAQNYNKDTADLNYTAIGNIIEILKNCPQSDSLTIDPTDKDLKFMDAGCGTGTLGKALRDQGYANIDGFDLSEDMVKQATSTGAYSQLFGNIDINTPIREQWIAHYDCTISIGVFTPGHVPPQALTQLVGMTRPGGMVIVSTRIAYYESENFQKTIDELEINGDIKTLYSLMNASYTRDEDAHYWVYTVLR